MRIIVFIIISFFVGLIKAQELFPNTEPASLVPAKVFGLRIMNETYNEAGTRRYWQGMLLMYGVNSKLMLNGMVSFSNHHGNGLPDNFILTDGNIGEHTHGISKGNEYPYKLESLSLGFRYRFLNLDEHHKHLRMALYGTGIYANQAHDEAETNLMGDNSGAGGGLITTYLVKKLAISLTCGAIVPAAYTDASKNIKLQYGNSYNYSLSFGYLLFPFKYSSYNQTNVNIYSEFMGKYNEALKVFKDDKSILIDNVPGFEKNNYVDWRPAIQFIVKSNLRIDVSGTFRLYKRSYVRTYPAVNLNVQYYFF